MAVAVPIVTCVIHVIAVFHWSAVARSLAFWRTYCSIRVDGILSLSLPSLCPAAMVWSELFSVKAVPNNSTLEVKPSNAALAIVAALYSAGWRYTGACVLPAATSGEQAGHLRIAGQPDLDVDTASVRGERVGPHHQYTQ